MSASRTGTDLPAIPPHVAPTPLWSQAPVRETVAAAAYRLLRAAILQGQIAAGQRINELELAASWNVSRTPIRDALRRLEAEGLVHAVPGRGVMVPVLALADADELYELREILEARAAKRAAEQGGGDLRLRLNDLLRAFGAALKQNDVARMNQVDVAIHSAVAEASGSGRLQRAIETVAGQVHPIRQFSYRVRGRGAKSLREMAKMVAAIRAGDPVRAETAMREHIASVRADLPAIFAAAE